MGWVFFQSEWYRENLKGLHLMHLRLLLLLWAKTTCEQYFRISALTWKALLFHRLNYLLHRDSLCHYVLRSRIFSMTQLYVSWCLSLPIDITTKHHLFIFLSASTSLPLQPSYISKKFLPQFLGAWGNGCLCSYMKINVFVPVQRGASDVFLLCNGDTWAL